MKRMTRLAAKLDKARDIDDDGNIEAGKDVKIDGNLKMNSLVSDGNPEGIFDPAGTGGGTIYHHAVRISRGDAEDIAFDIYNNQSEQLNFVTLKAALIGTHIACSGFRSQSGKRQHAFRLYLANNNTDIHVDLYTIDNNIVTTDAGNVGGPSVLSDNVTRVN